MKADMTPLFGERIHVNGRHWEQRQVTAKVYRGELTPTQCFIVRKPVSTIVDYQHSALFTKLSESEYELQISVSNK